MAVAHPKPKLRSDGLFFIIPRAAIPEDLARFVLQSKGHAAIGGYSSHFRVSA
jgi:hypothetical protein